MQTQFIVIFFVLGGFLFGQTDMTEGFQMLESGQYQQAKSFFNTVLEAEPDNLTAKLCLGRAEGLSGNTQKAQQLFEELLESKPNELEFQLNYAESLLWASEFDAAYEYYMPLVQEHFSHFGVLLGMANTCSNLKKYAEAKSYIQKALSIEPQNPNALQSLKYINLGYANQMLQEKNYAKSQELLDENLSHNPNDKETLENYASLLLITQNQKGLWELATYLEKSDVPELQLKGKQYSALSYHNEGKNKKALQTTTAMLQWMENHKELAQQEQFSAIERHTQALIWNEKFKEAASTIQELDTKFPDFEERVISLSVMLYTYQQQFQKAEKSLQTLLEKNSNSFDGNLGTAANYFALKQYKKSEEAVEKTLELFPNQPDAENLQLKINRTFAPKINLHSYFSKDKGDNEALKNTLNVLFPVSYKLSIEAFGSQRKTDNTQTNLQATQTQLGAGIHYAVIPQLQVFAKGWNNSVEENITPYSKFLIHSGFHWDIDSRKMIEGGFKQEMQDFNADLLEREILMNHYYVNANISFPFKLGWYLQYYYTDQSDDNTRNLFFTSLYYNLFPFLKFGGNFQYIQFDESLPSVYFSPENFTAYEGFIQLSQFDNPDKKKHWLYNVLTAVGVQNIEDEKTQNTLRIEANVGYKFSQRFQLMGYAMYSNIASTTAGGFEYNEFGIKLQYNFLQKTFR